MSFQLLSIVFAEVLAWGILMHAHAFWSSDLTESTQVGNSHRYGTCDSPGAAYFFQRTRIASGERKPPTHCSSYTVFEDPWNQCNAGHLDTYFKSNATVPGWVQVNVKPVQLMHVMALPFLLFPRSHGALICLDVCKGFNSTAAADLAARASCVNSYLALDSFGLVQHTSKIFKVTSAAQPSMHASTMLSRLDELRRIHRNELKLTHGAQVPRCL